MEEKIILLLLAVGLTSVIAQGPPCPSAAMSLYPETQEQLPHDCSMHNPVGEHCQYSNVHVYPIASQHFFNFPRLPAHPNPPVPHINPVQNLPDPLPPADSPFGPPMPPGMPLIIIPIYSPTQKDNQHPGNEGKIEKRHKKHKYSHHRLPRHHKEDPSKDTIPSVTEGYVNTHVSLTPVIQNWEEKQIDAADEEKYTANNWIPEEYQYMERKQRKQEADQLVRMPKLQYVDADGEIIFQKVLTDAETQQIADMRNQRFADEVKKEIELFNSNEISDVERRWAMLAGQDYVGHVIDEPGLSRRRFYKNGNLVYQ